MGLPRDVYAVTVRRRRPDGSLWEKTYHYHQPRRGSKNPGKRSKLPDDATSPEFWQAWRALTSPTNPTFGDLTQEYLAWLKESGTVEPSTYVSYERTARLYIQRTKDADAICHIAIADIRPSISQAFLDGLAAKPGVRVNAKTLLGAIESWAIVRDKLPRTIMTGVAVHYDGGGNEPWPAWAVELAIEHGAPWLQRAVYVGANTAQGVSDLVKFQGRDLEGGGINLRRKKTDKVIWVGLDPAVWATMQGWKIEPFAPIVPHPDGRAFKRGNELSWWFWYERKNNPALAPIAELGLSLHGLRATAVVNAGMKGLSDGEIANLYGLHEQTVRIYRRLADQRIRADATVLRMTGNGTQTERGHVKHLAGSAKYNPTHPKTSRKNK
ncbi:hypothetical protein ASD45_08345 [Pseudolabrys sp. Root1462]|uniref:hypothetical protein n=1 Tax=Pseudolabrys sp. Root1462 TaxID=1736466 RepID=UPI00070365FF|nr:hypothetical protein [Pseudolabrys sp. Root1462]KQZ00863.1 hypothetical protein ASD45_08345 [Pseudolabrys sp. Root1462]